MLPNRLYICKGLDKTRTLSGHNPNVSYFKVFGCKYFILIKGTHLSKFDSKTHEGIFVGYDADSHTYRIYNKTKRCVVETCDVEFDEDNGSQVEGSVSCDVRDIIPLESIRKMGAIFFCPIEELLLAKGEGPSSTQVEPSLSLDQASILEKLNAVQRQAQYP
jgi:hypothetical protein